MISMINTCKFYDIINLQSPSNFNGDFMVVDLEEAKVSLKSPTPFHKYGADFYPFTDERREELYTELNLPIRRGCVPLASILRRKSSDILDCVHHPAGSSCGKQQSLSNLTNKLVGVYMLSDGNSKGKVLEVYKQCKEKKLEFEIILVCAKRAPPLWSSSAWEDYVDSFVKNPDCCGWLKLPFDDRVCRRLHHLVLERYGWDSLTIIGPNNKYMDPHGLETIYENGIDGYPFTKQSICDNHETRIRSLDLQGLLNTVGIHHLIRHDGERVHISSVKDTDVLLCLGSCSSPITTASWDLLNWFHEMKRTSRKARFEMIYACLSKSNKCDECLARGGPWLSVSCKKDGNRCLALRDLLYGGLPYFTNKNSLVAFGSDGRVRRLSLQFTLLKKTGPATFPESDENLLRDVEVMLVSRCNQHWNSFSVARHKSHGQPSRSLAYYSNY